MSNPIGDRNLLAGILAYEKKFISREALIAAMNAWTQAKEKGLAQILREQKALTENQHALLEEAVFNQMAKHGHDAKNSLAALKSDDPIKQELAKIADVDLQASVAHIATAKPEVPIVLEEVVEVEETPKKKRAAVKAVKAAPKKSGTPTATARKSAGGISALVLLAGGGILGVFLAFIALIGVVLAFILVRDEKPIAQVKPDEAPLIRGKEENKDNDKPPIKEPDKGVKQADPMFEPTPTFEPAPLVKPKGQPVAVPLDPEGFVPLFNGKDLTGWKPHKTRAGDWRVENGIVVGAPVNNAAYFLQTEQPQPKDFHLRVEARIGAPGNGSVYVRFQPDGPIVGYEAMIRAANNQPGQVAVGGLGLNHPGKGKAFPGGIRTQVPAGQWFTLEVIAKGDRLIAKADGQTTMDVIDSTILTAGHIALGQIAQSKIEFRKIEIKELMAVALAPPALKAPPVVMDAPPFPVEAGFVPLFNGKDLSNWKQSAAKPRNWQVVNGILTGEGGGLNMLYTPRDDYGDFHLRAEIRMNEDTSSSLAFRYPYGPAELEKSKLAGYVVRMTGKPIGFNRTGNLMIWEKLGARNLPAPPNAIKAGEWFNLEIIARGESTITRLNGVESLNHVYPKANILGGRIVLEALTVVRNPRIEYRKLEIKEFKAVPAPPPPLPEQPLGDFVKLFNGKDLAEWRVEGAWKVIDGEIVGQGPGALVSRRSDFRNCIVRVEVLPSDDIEAFFSFREQAGMPMKGLSSRLTGDGKVIRAGHTGIDGSIGESGALPNDFKANQWMTIEFRVRPESFATKTNGKGSGGVGYHPERFPAGAVGLHVIKGSARIRRFEISSELAPGAAPPPVVAAGEFVPLFNGKDLTGWKTHPKHPGEWRVDNGILIGKAPPKWQTILHTERADFKDFHLRVEARGSLKCLGTVGIRSVDGGNHGYAASFSGIFPPTFIRVGGVAAYTDDNKGFTLPRLVDVDFPPGQWFTLEVIAAGKRLTVLVDGKKVTDVNNATILAAGHINLGISGPDTIEVRKVESAEFKAAAEPPPVVAAGAFLPLFNKKDLTGWRVEGNDGWKVNEAGELVGQGADTAIITKRTDYRNLIAKIELSASADIEAFFGFRETQAPGAKVVGLTSRLNGEGEIVRAGNSGNNGSKVELGKPRLEVKPGEVFLLEFHLHKNNLQMIANGMNTGIVIYAPANNVPGAIGLHIVKGTVRIKKFEISAEAPAGQEVIAPPPKEKPPAGAVPLFNGKDLTGWQPHAKRPGNWRVENGILIGSAPNGGSLYSTRGDYQDFHLRAEVRINDKGFGRIFGRAAYDPTKIPFKVLGYEVLVNQRPLGDKTGTLTATSSMHISSTQAKEPPAAAGAWLLVEIIAKGDLVTVKVNAQSVAEFRDEKRHFAPSGHIALHQDANATIEFRKVEIEDLSAP